MERKEHAICLGISVRAAEILAHVNPVFDQQGAVQMPK